MIKPAAMKSICAVVPFACVLAASPQPASIKITEVPRGASAADKHTVRLSVTVTNNSDGPINVHNTNTYCDYRVIVLTSAGTPAPETEFGKKFECGDDDPDIPHLTGRNFTITLQPGESTSDVVVVTQQYDLSQPGKYTVQVRRRFSVIGRINSNIITVVIEP